ncbi:MULTISPECIES: hypothetical protein [Thermodesulfovibrio]|uniref:hypothetical protein n=1 Tax=Thermodesulfovibrio yellowstonii TaxID=28262 RepID=UPI00040A0D40|nr:hypothetical protein [Thermodesulfovibrio islandicus]
MIKKFFIAISLVLIMSSNLSAADNLSGEYRLKKKGVQGGMDIKMLGKDRFKFSIDTLTGGWYSCNLEGVATMQGKNKAIYKGENDCIMTFTIGKDQIKVEHTYGCNYFCGLNGSMDGLYVKTKKKSKQEDSWENVNWEKFIKTNDGLTEIYYDKDSVAPSVGGGVYVTTKITEKSKDYIIADLFVNCSNKNQDIELISVFVKKGKEWSEDSSTNPSLQRWLQLYRNKTVKEFIHKIACGN